MNRYQLTIPASDLDFAATVTSGMMFRWRREGDVWVGHDGAARYRVTAQGDHYDVETDQPITAFRSLFRLDEDTAAIAQRIALAVPELSDVLCHRRIRLLAPACPVEATVAFLCTANNTLHRIVPMVNALAHPGGAFLGLEEVADLPEERLRARGFGYRAATIPRAARAMLEQGGEEWLLGLRRQPYEAARAQLIALPGVGPKLADCICLFALHHTESVPVDTHVWQQLQPRLAPEWQGLPFTPRRGQDLAARLRERCGRDAAWAQQWAFFHGLSQGPARGMVQT